MSNPNMSNPNNSLHNPNDPNGRQSGQGPSPAIAPTYRGYVASTMDALKLFEACMLGRLNHIPRRPHDREREELIKSGNIFIYEEYSSGIKRWTDGFNWSPSRIQNNFLLYRELDGAFPPGEKKKALKKNARPASGNGAKNSTPRPNPGAVIGEPPTNGVKSEDDQFMRSLTGSLVDSYQFKEGGMIKKTISMAWQGVNHHLVSYYAIDDVVQGKLPIPCADERLRDIVPRPALISAQNFRVPVAEEAVQWSPDDNKFWVLQGAAAHAANMSQVHMGGHLSHGHVNSWAGPDMHYLAAQAQHLHLRQLQHQQVPPHILHPGTPHFALSHRQGHMPHPHVLHQHHAMHQHHSISQHPPLQHQNMSQHPVLPHQENGMPQSEDGMSHQSNDMSHHPGMPHQQDVPQALGQQQLPPPDHSQGGLGDYEVQQPMAPQWHYSASS